MPLHLDIEGLPLSDPSICLCSDLCLALHRQTHTDRGLNVRELAPNMKIDGKAAENVQAALGLISL